MSDRNRAAEQESPAETDRTAEAPHGNERAERRSGALSSLDPVAAYERRTTRIREEIARNRRGEYTVPTWVLALALAAVIGLWALVLFVL
jgi:ferric-dicitrate binding protein FerR (iron transport regulator)